MAYTLPEFHAMLRRSKWNSNLLARILKADHTQVGQYIDKAEGPFGKITAAVLDRDLYGHASNVAAAERARAALHAERDGKIGPCIHALRDLAAFSNKKANEYRSKTLVPKNVREHLEVIHTQATALANRLDKDLAEADEAAQQAIAHATSQEHLQQAAARSASASEAALIGRIKLATSHLDAVGHELTEVDNLAEKARDADQRYHADAKKDNKVWDAAVKEGAALAAQAKAVWERAQGHWKTAETEMAEVSKMFHAADEAVRRSVGKQATNLQDTHKIAGMIYASTPRKLEGLNNRIAGWREMQDAALVAAKSASGSAAAVMGRLKGLERRYHAIDTDLTMIDNHINRMRELNTMLYPVSKASPDLWRSAPLEGERLEKEAAKAWERVEAGMKEAQAEYDETMGMLQNAPDAVKAELKAPREKVETIRSLATRIAGGLKKRVEVMGTMVTEWKQEAERMTAGNEV
jgi:hypothetical protein